jgi:hypothetical protein
MDSNFTWSLDLLDNLWAIGFGLLFIFIIIFHIFSGIEEEREKKKFKNKN